MSTLVPADQLQVVTLMHAHGFLMPDDDGPDGIEHLTTTHPTDQGQRQDAGAEGEL